MSVVRALPRAPEPKPALIDSLDLDGRGVARVDGKVVFIEGALPGERVTWQRHRSKARYDSGRVVQVLRASALRARPRCAHFGLEPGSCGGCSMQHLEARAQVSVKQRALEETLWRIGGVRPEQVLRPIGGPAWNYRQRARLAVRFVARKGGVLVGFHERASSFVADLRSCAVLAEPVGSMLLALRALVSDLSIRARLPQIEVAVAPDVTALVLRVLEPMNEADEDLLDAFAHAHGVSFWIQPAGPDSARPLRGPAEPLALPLPEFGLALPFLPTDFTQVNHAANEILVRRALALLDPGPAETAVDLFCGLGNFTLPIATRARQVLGIEGNPALVERAGAAAGNAGLAHKARFAVRDLFALTPQDWIGLRAAAGGRIDRVLVDPPRDGALAALKAIGQDSVAPRRLVYVSCNPATLARDCGWIAHEAGWRLRSAGVVNMFPHTSHVESIAVLEPPEGSAA